ncbi:MAG: ChaN family lipoprotein [Desulfobacterales bacterium]|nr:ChaN family lipoprotein [Desulfobacterales bacterium]
MTIKKNIVKGISRPFDEGTIISTDTGSPISYKTLIAELNRVQLIYVGEKHTDPVHHEIQLNIIKNIFKLNQNIFVGMEMFDRSYQSVLDQWAAGNLDRKTFLKKTHWYANWEMDYQLYSNILDYIKENKIKLIGLNIPFHIPPKIATGGISSLSNTEKQYLPIDIDTSNSGHRQYVKKIFDLHHVKGMDDFENFYATQCVWEDTMAEAIARNVTDGKMIIIAGNGHIIQKFGIPDRAYKRTGASFRTLFLSPVGNETDRSFADYIWITPSPGKGIEKTETKNP